ncbi:MAG: site-specific integrase [Lachnospiraceae bacterium]|mgnify:CR=1 FL=1|nr:site-specific integrase [Lachnospiraceae bacterium]
MVSIMNNQTNVSDKKEILQYAVDSGIINLESIKNVVDDMTKKEILAQHKYAIVQGSDGRWSTRVPLDDGTSAVRHRKTREELEDYLVNYYKELKKSIYIKDVFWKWMNEKLDYGEIKKQSYDKYCAEFKRFFTKDSFICIKKMKNITEEDLERFIKTTIRDMELTRKAYSGLVTLLNGIFKYGKKMGCTTISISTFIKDLYLPKNIFKKNFKDKKTEVFMEDEIPVIIGYLKENPDIWNLALLLQFETGARIGEISTLKKEDIKKHSILIRRTEVKIKIDDVWKMVVSELPKTDAGYREIILPPSAQWTISKILELNPNGDFLFMDKGKRIRENTYNKRLNRICEKLNIPHRTTHKIRKTYGTTLLDSDVNDSFVAEQMGHTDVSTTRKLYYYSNKSYKTKLNQISGAISF